MQSWKVFAVLYTLGATGYAIGAKFSGGRVSPLLGALIMTAVSLAIIIGFFIYTKVYGGHFTYNRYGVEAAIFAGFSIALADIALFFMYARGADLSVAGVMAEVISVGLIVLVGLFFFKEALTFTKAAGLLLSIIGLVLLFEG